MLASSHQCNCGNEAVDQGGIAGREADSDTECGVASCRGCVVFQFQLPAIRARDRSFQVARLASIEAHTVRLCTVVSSRRHLGLGAMPASCSERAQASQELERRAWPSSPGSLDQFPCAGLQVSSHKVVWPRRGCWCGTYCGGSSSGSQVISCSRHGK